ncbi:hypothetical protein [Bacillus sp. Marseille-Q3570]|uniref:hypothetical protein n=1 Tax=Bacillus sp. Marseille-Q3570 TaxID=2963522 RepID=UPI0021B73953|nr:hypothetical protein [Bacillus sp. Marseille-Q3570]
MEQSYSIADNVPQQTTEIAQPYLIGARHHLRVVGGEGLQIGARHHQRVVGGEGLQIGARHHLRVVGGEGLQNSARHSLRHSLKNSFTK